MNGSSGSEPKIRIDRSGILVSPLSSGPIREELVIMNEGKGRLYGNIRSDAAWVTVLDTTLNTTFIQRVILEIRPDKAPASGESWVHILSTGGIGRVKIELRRTPAPVSSLRLDEKVFQFCGITKDEPVSFSLTVRNAGSGFLSGTAVPLSDWIEIPVRGIWTRTVQVIPVRILPSNAPRARHPVGRIHIKTNGGEETVEVSIHRSEEKGPVARFIPSSLRISWTVRGIIEERLIVKNMGSGTLRGTIPSKYPWITAVPSIFSVTESTIITIRVDTRLLTGNLPASVPLVIITNTGLFTLNIEISRSYQAQVKARTRLPRIRTRSRMIVLDQQGSQLQIISSGKSGGEGEIWYIEGDDSRCVKIFHPHRSSPEMEEKIRVMQKSPLQTPPGTGICWPSGIVVSTASPQRFLGYLMTRLGSSYMPVHAWYDAPDQDFSFALKAAARLAGLVHAVHMNGHCVGDLRENNVFISTSGEICLIDTDSFQITDPSSSKTWFCRVGTGEYLPPELIDGAFERQDIDRLFSDRFALAVLIFRFLMQGAHPYQGRGPLIEDAPTTPDKIIRGLFAYEGKIPGLYPPEYAPPYDRIPAPVRALFHEAFVTGHQHPAARPDPLRWTEVLGMRPDAQACVSPQLVLITSNPEQKTAVKPDATEPFCPPYVDGDGHQVLIGRRLIRISHGEIRETDRSGYQILIGMKRLFKVPNLPASQVPPSVIIPDSIISPAQNPASRQIPGHERWYYRIPMIDLSRYVHWHVAADPSGCRSWIRKFSFRHRVAACRNLLSALLSIHRAGLHPYCLSPRSVFIGPDSSVRIIAALADDEKPEREERISQISEVRILLSMMMMDGCNPCQVAERSYRIFPRYVPSPDRIPYPMRRIFSDHADISESIEDVLTDWFTRADLAFSSLISCHMDSNHWYCIVPGVCPFCHPDHMLRILPLQPERFFLPGQKVLFLPPPLHTVRYLKRRRIQKERTGVPVICLSFPLFMVPRISGSQVLSLPARTSDANLLPVCRIRNLPVCLPRPITALVCIAPVFSLEAMIRARFDISLIDEMRWISALEQMKGTLFPRLIRIRKERRQYVRKTISVMILPGYFEVPKKQPASKTKKGKKGKTKGKLTKKLSEFIGEFFG